MTADDHLQGQSRPSAEQVAWVFHHLNEHYAEGGSFRHLKKVLSATGTPPVQYDESDPD